MTSTVFQSGTVIDSVWLNDVDALVYQGQLDNGTTGASISRYLPAGTGAVATTVQSKLRESVSVKDFGAVGDGVTNDQAALQAAITYATANNVALYVPTGTYYFPNTSDALRFTGNLIMRGDGPELSILYYNDSASATRKDMFLSLACGYVSFEGIRFESDWSVGGNYTQTSQMIGLAGDSTTSTLHINNCEFRNGRFMLLAVSYFIEARVTNSTFFGSNRDGCRLTGCQRVTVANNYFKDVNDDSIAVHTIDAEANPAKSDVVIAGNKIIDSQGIAVLGGKHCSITGNVITRPSTRGIWVGLSSGAGTEGNTSVVSVTVTGNVVTDLFKGTTFNPTSGNNGGYISVNGLIPQVVGGKFVDYGADALSPYPYFYDNSLALTDVRSGNYGSVISGNVCMRTLEPGVAYSSYGYGSRRSRAGLVDPAITATSFDAGGAVALRNCARNVVIANNHVQGIYGYAVNLESTNLTSVAPAWYNIKIQGNIIYDIQESASILAVPILINGYGTVDIIGNTLDLDPYVVNSNRNGLDGTWTTVNNAPAIWTNGGAVTGQIKNNTFKNCGTLYLAGTFRGVWDSNVVYCDPYGSLATNKGVGDIKYQAYGIRYTIWDCDKTSATFNWLINECQTASSALPTTGKYVAGAVVAKFNPTVVGTAPNQYIVTGWMRLTTGSNHVLNTDWVEMRTLTGT